MMAPELPADFVQRAAEFGEVKKQLVGAGGRTVAITAALKGAGGYGKTTLATALAHDLEILNAYVDGILWVELGERPKNLLSTVSDLIEFLTGDRPGFEDINVATAKLGEALADRRILLIIDDVWHERDLRPFLRVGSRTTRLITTRDSQAIPFDAFRQPVDTMTEAEALQLLSSGLPSDQVLVERKALNELARRLGAWAQLLKLVNGYLQARVTDSGDALCDAIADANARLNEEGLVSFDAGDEVDRTRTVAHTINLSLSLLAKDQARFSELAVFPEHAEIPVGVIGRLWKTTAGFGDRATKDLLSKLNRLSLLASLNLRNTVRFHENIRHFLRDRAGSGGIVALHKQLLTALDDVAQSAEAEVSVRRYFYKYRVYHLADACELQALDALLLDPSWLVDQLAALDSPLALLSDYDRYAACEAHRLIERTLRLIAGICTRDRRQLIPQLLGRLMTCQDATVAEFVEGARVLLTLPAVLAQRPTLTRPGAEIARLDGHTHSVTALCVLPDNRLASGSYDSTIRLWDVHTGIETGRLDGQAAPVKALCVLPDGRLAAGYGDGTIRLWNLATGAETARLVGHTNSVAALCVLADGRLASGSEDTHTTGLGREKMIRLWDPASGLETACLNGHRESVTALCLLPDNRLASGSDDSTIRLWDVVGGAGTACIEFGPVTRTITALCMMPSGRLAAGSTGNTIRLWDLTTGAETARLWGLSGPIGALCPLQDGRLAIGSDHTIRLWQPAGDADTLFDVAELNGHAADVTTLCVLPDGRLASGSDDKTIRLWDPTDCAQTALTPDHRGTITALCLLPDGRVASGSYDTYVGLWAPASGANIHRYCFGSNIDALCMLRDGRLAVGTHRNTIQLLDLETGAETRLEGHKGRVLALCVLPDGRLASASSDYTIRLWDPASGAETACLKGHRRSVFALCVLPDGRLASGSRDKTIRFWDTANGAQTTCLEGHTNSVAALCVLPDGRLASGSHDNTVRLWNPATGAETDRLDGHSQGINALCLLPDGRLASGSYDKTIRVWDPTSGARREIASLEIDAPIHCIVTLWPDGPIIAGDQRGVLHWLKIVG